MIVTVLAAWFVGNQSKHGRNTGFWLFLFSNVLWVIWGWHDRAYALITLQIALARRKRGQKEKKEKKGSEEKKAEEKKGSELTIDTSLTC